MTCMLINPFVEQSHYLLIALWMCSFSFYAIATTQNKACGGLHRGSAICVAPTGMGVSLASQFSCLPQGLYWPDEKKGGKPCTGFPPVVWAKGTFGVATGGIQGSQGAVLRELRFFNLAGIYNLLEQIDFENTHFQNLRHAHSGAFQRR